MKNTYGNDLLATYRAQIEDVLTTDEKRRYDEYSFYEVYEITFSDCDVESFVYGCLCCAGLTTFLTFCMPATVCGCNWVESCCCGCTCFADLRGICFADCKGFCCVCDACVGASEGCTSGDCGCCSGGPTAGDGTGGSTTSGSGMVSGGTDNGCCSCVCNGDECSGGCDCCGSGESDSGGIPGDDEFYDYFQDQYG